MTTRRARILIFEQPLENKPPIRKGAMKLRLIDASCQLLGRVQDIEPGITRKPLNPLQGVKRNA